MGAIRNKEKEHPSYHPGGREAERGDITRAGGGLRILMSYNKTKTRFTKLIRIDPEQYQWIIDNKDTRTYAGFLDKIINEYKNGKEEI